MSGNGCCGSGNSLFGGCDCLWIIIILILLFCCCGNNNNGTNGCCQ